MPPIVIHGRNITQPPKCEMRDGDVVGVWYIDFDEPGCKPYWDSMKDMGCMPSNPGFRRYESKLIGIAKGESWERMCNTAPATFGVKHFDRPTSCDNRGIFGMFGIWEVPDSGWWCR
ncbi:hypothetical protein C8Q78DRAFT_1002525 [Trametes maxima]|nr:hypothetical protein C8Q78DRAFT_1002525 [Trametes maxima]